LRIKSIAQRGRFARICRVYQHRPRSKTKLYREKGQIEHKGDCFPKPINVGSFSVLSDVVPRRFAFVGPVAVRMVGDEKSRPLTIDDRSNIDLITAERMCRAYGRAA